MDVPRWVDTRLFPQLVQHMPLTSADELRRQLHALLERALIAPAPRARRAEVLESGSGPIVRPDPEMLKPRVQTSTLIAWADPFTVRELTAVLPQDTRVVVVRNGIELALTLAVTDTPVSVVLIDRRDHGLRLEPVLAHHLRAQRVLVWGVESLSAPKWRRTVEESEHAMSSASEADIEDIAELCTRLLDGHF